MEHPIFKNRIWLLGYVLVWTLVSLAISLTVTSLLMFSLSQGLLCGFVSGYGFAVLALPLWNVLKYADYSSQKYWQSTVSYLALGVLTVFVWIMGQYLLFDSFFAMNMYAFSFLLPLLLLLGACFFAITVLVYQKWLAMQARLVEDEPLPEPESEEEPTTEPEEMLERIAVKTKQNIEVVLVPDIVCIQSEGDYVKIFTQKAHFLKELTMKYLEQHLPANQFVRVHRSTIVNVSAISKIELFEKQSYLVVLKNGAKIKASLSGYKLLKSVLSL